MSVSRVSDFEEGEIPYKQMVSANAIAQCLDVSTPTVLEHLRKGEQKVLNLFLDKLGKRREKYR